ncbi:hypothetical protein [Kutzneria chonburiensis]|uniref:Uncharacterized protein n=1 Tax=Kutzneria chonburiensis TaxID=1483604 RepID=A0ABV6N360_9PSEU|nr:hypothetical protein [Kutzneria chonburiensis]
MAITRQVLALLAKSNAKITVFAVGTWADLDPGRRAHGPRRRPRAGQPHVEPSGP